MLFFSLQQQVFASSRSVHEGSCECTDNNVRLTFLDYVSFGGMPVFPYRLHHSQTCLACQKQPLSLANGPFFSWWHVAFKCLGLVVLLAALLVGLMYLQAEKERQVALLKSPQVHDFYLMDYSLFRQEAYYQKQFLVAKVTAVDELTVSLQLANYRYQRQNQVIKAIKLDNLIKADYFNKEVEHVKRAALTQLFSDGAIYQVLRAEGLTLFGGIVEMPSRPEPLYKGFKQNKANQDGVSLYQQGAFAEARTYFKQAAEQGDRFGQANLADMYRKGLGGPVDLKQALYWYQQAAEQGHENAGIQVTALCNEYSLCDAP